VSWESQKQRVVARSTYESELFSIDQAVREVKWMVDSFRKIGQKKFAPKKFFVDNQGAIAFTETSGVSERKKK